MVSLYILLGLSLFIQAFDEIKGKFYTHRNELEANQAKIADTNYPQASKYPSQKNLNPKYN